MRSVLFACQKYTCKILIQHSKSWGYGAVIDHVSLFGSSLITQAMQPIQVFVLDTRESTRQCLVLLTRRMTDILDGYATVSTEVCLTQRFDSMVYLLTRGKLFKLGVSILYLDFTMPAPGLEQRLLRPKAESTLGTVLH